MVLNKELKIQYQIMNIENDDGYVPDYDELIKEAPTSTIADKWREAKKYVDTFAFNCIYIMQMRCGHWEIYQTPVKCEEDLIEWVNLMYEHKNYSDCSRCKTAGIGV